MNKDKTRRREMKRGDVAAKKNSANGYDELMRQVDRAAWKGLKAGAKLGVFGSIGLARFAVAGVRWIKAQRAHDGLVSRRARRIGKGGKD